MQVVARFDPPEAEAKLDRWRSQHADALEDVPTSAVHVETGRVAKGEFVRVSVADAYVDRIARDIMEPEQELPRVLSRSLRLVYLVLGLENLALGVAGALRGTAVWLVAFWLVFGPVALLLALLCPRPWRRRR